LIPQLVENLRAGDVVLVKGSNGSRMSRVVDALSALGAARP
jgi:UDP-N-acetylmuramoyl-tripeptide--D-alanyl-D-alanine ligase